MPRIILLSIDGFGMGAMSDIDNNLKNANTWKTILNNTKEDELLTFKKMMLSSSKLRLDYMGADSYLGHLTMSGIEVKELDIKSLNYYFDEIKKTIIKAGFNFRESKGLMIIDEAVVIGDNFEAESGLAINLSGLRDVISREKQDEIATIVRKIVKVPRVISFGADTITLKNLLDNNLTNGEFNGIDTPNTGIYNDSFDVIHMPFISNFDDSIQNKMFKKGYDIYMYGKFTDIIKINFAKVFNQENNTKKVLDQAINDINANPNMSFFCINVQETDLAGHQSDIVKYVNTLKEIEIFLNNLKLSNNDVMIITSDHGNDPLANTSKHTREFVPYIWISSKEKPQASKLSDIPRIIL